MRSSVSLGILSAGLAILFNSVLMDFRYQPYRDLLPDYLSLIFFYQVYVGPFVEEALKGYFVIFALSRRGKNNDQDGFSIGLGVGYGFTLVEASFYAFDHLRLSTGMVEFLQRIIFLPINHGLFTSVFGVMWVRGHRASALLVATLLHMIWNYTTTNIVVIVVFFIGFIILYRVVTRK